MTAVHPRDLSNRKEEWLLWKEGAISSCATDL